MLIIGPYISSRINKRLKANKILAEFNVLFELAIIFIVFGIYYLNFFVFNCTFIYYLGFIIGNFLYFALLLFFYYCFSYMYCANFDWPLMLFKILLCLR